MVTVIERSVSSPSPGDPFDISLSPDGNIFTPHINATVAVVNRVRSGTSFVAGSMTSYGSFASAGGGFTADSQHQWLNASTFAYKGDRTPSTTAFVRDTGVSYTTGGVRAFDVSPSGHLFAYGVSNSVYVVNALTLTALYNYNTGGLIESVSFSPDGKYLLVGSRTTALNIFKLTAGPTVTRIGTVGSVNQGNWNLAWHPNSDHFAACAYSGGNGVHIYKLTGTDTFTRLTAPYDDTAIAVGVTGVGYTKSGFLIFGAYATADLRVYKRNGDTYERQTVTGLVNEAVSGVRGARDVDTFAISAPGTINLRVYDFDYNRLVNGAMEGFLPTMVGEAEIPVKVNGAGEGFLPTMDSLVVLIPEVTAALAGLLPSTDATATFGDPTPSIGLELVLTGPVAYSQPGAVSVADEVPVGNFAYGFTSGLLPELSAVVFQDIRITTDLVGYLPSVDGATGEPLAVTGEMMGYVPSLTGIVDATDAWGELVGLLPETDGLAEYLPPRIDTDVLGLLPEAAGEASLAFRISGEMVGYQVTSSGLVDTTDAWGYLIGLLPTTDSVIASTGVLGDMPGLLPEMVGLGGVLIKVDSNADGLLPEIAAVVYQDVLITADLVGYAPTTDALGDVQTIDIETDIPGLLPYVDMEIYWPEGVAADLEGFLPLMEAEGKVLQTAMAEMVNFLPVLAGVVAKVNRADANIRGFLPTMAGLAGTPMRINDDILGYLPTVDGSAFLRSYANSDMQGFLPGAEASVLARYRISAELTLTLPEMDGEAFVRYVVTAPANGYLPTLDAAAVLRYLMSGDLVGYLPVTSGGTADNSERAYAARPNVGNGSTLSVGGGVFFGFGNTLISG